MIVRAIGDQDGEQASQVSVKDSLCRPPVLRTSYVALLSPVGNRAVRWCFAHLFAPSRRE